MIYTDRAARTLRHFAGMPWRPGNADAYLLFVQGWCDRCVRADCSIRCRMLIYSLDSERYPKALQIGPDGQPVCGGF